MNEEITIDGVRYRRMDRMATRVSTHVMFDCHLFGELKARTVQGLVDEWRMFIKGGAKYSERYGPAYLCPVSVMDGDKELRRVGTMVFPDSGECDRELGKWLREVNADPDIARLLAQRT